MRRVAVRNEKEFRAWLETQPQEVCVAIAWREAMRVLPLGMDLDLFARADLFVLAVLRNNLAAGAAAAVATGNLRRAAADARIYGGRAFETFSKSVAALNSAAFTAFSASDKAVTYAYSNSAWPGGLQYSSLAAFADVDRDPAALMVSEILVPQDVKAEIFEYFAQRRSALAAVGPWEFWGRWYARAMAGDPLPWDLQEKIALIPNEIWEAGPEAVAEEIARIEAASELRQRIAEVEAEQANVAEKRLGIGGNNPPEEIDDPETVQQVVILWESIAGLKEEVEANEPDAERVAALIERLAAALKTVIAWCGRKADLIVDTTIKWGIPTSGGYLVMNPAKAESVLKAAQTWLPFLAP